MSQNEPGAGLEIHLQVGWKPVAAVAVVVLAVFAVAAGWIGLTQVLWLGLILCCPLMMLFMHGHNDHGPAGHAQSHEVHDQPLDRVRR